MHRASTNRGEASNYGTANLRTSYRIIRDGTSLILGSLCIGIKGGIGKPVCTRVLKVECHPYHTGRYLFGNVCLPFYGTTS
jgi:hypothetical protein